MFKETMCGQPKLYLNFMKMYGVLFLFTQVTREELWNLCLAQLERMIRSFLPMIYRIILDYC